MIARLPRSRVWEALTLDHLRYDSLILKTWTLAECAERDVNVASNQHLGAVRCLGGDVKAYTDASISSFWAATCTRPAGVLANHHVIEN